MPTPLQDTLSSPAALSRFVLTTILGVALDLWTKSLAFKKLAYAVVTLRSGRVTVYPKSPYPFIPGWIEFEVTANQGAVFGMGQGQRWLFVFVSIGAILFLTYLFATSGKRRGYQIILGMLLAGVLGNMYDRIALGYVRDMIHGLPRWQHLFPWIFNVADTLLCTGVGLMILYSLIPSHQGKSSLAPDIQNA
jgi:signal peptidase II